jgi:hypothetical protein
MKSHILPSRRRDFRTGAAIAGWPVEGAKRRNRPLGLAWRGGGEKVFFVFWKVVPKGPKGRKGRKGREGRETATGSVAVCRIRLRSEATARQVVAGTGRAGGYRRLNSDKVMQVVDFPHLRWASVFSGRQNHKLQTKERRSWGQFLGRWPFHAGDARWRKGRTNQSLVTGVLPKSREPKVEAAARWQASSRTTTFGDLDVAATLESRAPGFGQYALTSSRTYELNGAPDGDSGFQGRVAHETWNLFRLIPRIPLNSAFGRTFFIFGEGESEGTKRTEGRDCGGGFGAVFRCQQMLAILPKARHAKAACFSGRTDAAGND